MNTMAKETTQQVVLMYHGIVSKESSIAEDREIGAELYDVSIEDFRNQMAWLKDHGYVPTVDHDGRGTAGRAPTDIMLTFDDGEINNFEQALPILREYEFRACFFIIAKRIGKQGYMGWEEIKRLHEGGMTIGSHGFSHEILTNLIDTQIEEELSASKKYLERNLNIKIDALSIPRGFCNDKILQMAYDVGYKTIFISERPKNLKAHCLSRVAVKGSWTLKRFGQAVAGHIPWRESIFESCKNAIKKILGEAGYDWIRRVLLKAK
jgi:peptidoglycan/xylan/chitin deacetylase (PgdA/CDA1 family)